MFLLRAVLNILVRNDPNGRLSAPSICFVCVFVCRKLSPHLGV